MHGRQVLYHQTSPGLFLLWFKVFLFDFTLYVCMFAYMHICITCFWCPRRPGEGCQSHWSWSNRWLWDTMQETEPRSSIRTSALNCQASSQAPNFSLFNLRVSLTKVPRLALNSLVAHSPALTSWESGIISLGTRSNLCYLDIKETEIQSTLAHGLPLSFSALLGLSLPLCIQLNSQGKGVQPESLVYQSAWL